MRLETSVLVVLALTGCGGEPVFNRDLPPGDLGSARPVDSETHTDLIVQTINPSVDILFLVDNSCSMAGEQADLADNFPSFMRHFLNSGLDYHIGVISSDIVNPQENGKLQGGLGELWITPEQNNQINRFTAMAVLGAGGAFPEKGLTAIYRSIENEGDAHNRGFFRDDSALHTICVTDELDYSTNPELQGGVDEFIGWYDGLKRIADNRSFSAIEDPNARAYTSGGKPYGRVTQSIGGVLWDIKVDDWSPALDVLGLRATGLKTEYFLSQLPVEDSIEVALAIPIEGTDEYNNLPQVEAEEVDGELVGDWLYTPGRNSVTFLSDVPAERSRIAITYTVRSSVVSDPLD